MTGDTRLCIQTKIYQDRELPPDEMETCVDARIYEKETGCFILYDQMDPDSGMKVSYRLRITDSGMEIAGKGAMENTMELKIGQTTRADYKTPYGRLLMDVKTSYLRILREKDKLVLEAEYELWAEDSFVSRNCLMIKTAG